MLDSHEKIMKCANCIIGIIRSTILLANCTGLPRLLPQLFDKMQYKIQAELKNHWIISLKWIFYKVFS